MELVREYKLIKKYPGLPANWEEGMIVSRGDHRDKETYLPIKSKYTQIAIIYRAVENFPDFWERQEKKVIFTTEDGRDITDDLANLELYGVLTKANWQKQTLPCSAWLDRDIKNTWKVFYDVDNMEDYILMHKPQFSLDELMYVVNLWAMSEMTRDGIVKKICEYREQNFEQDE